MAAQSITHEDTSRVIKMVNHPDTPEEIRLSKLLDLAVYFRSSDVVECYYYANRAYHVADAIGDSVRKGTACRLMGVSYVLQGNNAEAARWTIKSYQIAERNGTENNLLSAGINLGGIFYELKDWEQSLRYTKTALAIGIESENENIIAASSEAMALVYIELNEPDSAESYFRTAMTLYKKNGREKALANCISSFAGVYEIRNDYQKALQQIREASSIFQRLDEGSPSNEFISCKLGAVEILLKVNRISEAAQNLDLVESVSREQNLRNYLSDVYLLRSRMDSLRGNYESSLTWLNRHMDLRDSILTSDKDRIIQSAIEMQKLQTATAIDIGDQRLSQAKLKSQRITLGIVLAALFILSLLTGELIRRNRQIRLTNERLASKQSVIQKKNRNLEEIGRELLTQKKELENLNRNKDRWFGIVSHDFRHPLTVLHGAISLMAEEDLPPDEQKIVFTDLKKQFSRTSFLLDNLLFWAQHQLDGWKANYEAIPSGELLNPVLESAEATASQKGIKISCDCNGGFIILTDPEAVRLIIRNLVNNAIKFSYPGSSIWVTSVDSEESWNISVRDQGVGMTDEQIEKAFDNIQESTLGTQKEKGSGLGLNLCRDFAQFLGGELQIESEVGKGSTFTLILPKGGDASENY